jgi:hypothetical protein
MLVHDLAGCLALAAIAASLMLLWRARAPLGADEGYLWYGVQQWLKGRMPHRDFKSYEPGRYLWCGGFARMFGPGLLVVRGASHLFFALGLAAALCALRALGLGWPIVACAAAALALLSHPQHKQFEHGAVLLAWTADIYLWAFPSTWTLAWAAATTGLALMVGFNLFLYFGAALLLTLAAGVISGAIAVDRQMLLVLVGSGALGLLPFATMLCSPGFARNFRRRRVTTVVERGESNLSLPLPWPWRAAPGQLQALDPSHRIGYQWLFLVVLALPPVALVLSVAWPASMSMLMPAGALGLFLSHHALSRADPPHIIQSLGPSCLLAFQLGGSHLGVAMMIVAIALWLVWPLHHPLKRSHRAAEFTRRDAGGYAIDTGQFDGRMLDLVSSLCAGDSTTPVFAAPAFPALYARLGFDSPVYDTFSLYPAGVPAQQDMIRGIVQSDVRIAVVSNAPVDGREELRFARTHDLVWAFLHDHFSIQPAHALGADTHVFTRLDRGDGRLADQPLK